MKSLVVHAVLALAGLVLAYRVWAGRDAPEVSADAVTLLECPPARLESLELVAEGKRVTLASTREEGDAVYRFVVARLPREAGEPAEGRSEEASSEADPASAADAAAPPKAFLGAPETVETYLKNLAPLRAIRSLGEPAPELLEALELDDPSGTFTLRCGGTERTYELGGTAFGSGDRYLRERGGKTVYLVAADLLRDLQSADFRMIQRDLHDFEWKDVASVVVRSEGAETTLLQRDRLTPEQAQWVDAEAPDRRNELYDNWMQRVQRLRVQDYLAADAEPGSDLADDVRAAAAPPVDALELVYRGEDDRELGRLALARVETPTQYWLYARSDATRGWTSLMRSAATQVEDDARLVLGLAPVERPEDRPPESTPADAAAAPAEPGAAPAAPSAPQGDAAAPPAPRPTVPATTR